MGNVLDGGLYETYHLDPSRQLEAVEADKCYQVRVVKGCPEKSNARLRTATTRAATARSRHRRDGPSTPLLGLVQHRDKTDPDAPAAIIWQSWRMCAPRPSNPLSLPR